MSTEVRQVVVEKRRSKHVKEIFLCKTTRPSTLRELQLLQGVPSLRQDLKTSTTPLPFRFVT